MMMKPVSIAALALAAACGANALANADGVPETRWVTSWYTAPQAVWGSGFVLPTNVPRWLDNQALRETIRLSAGGRAVRVLFAHAWWRRVCRRRQFRSAWWAPKQNGVPAFA